MRTLLVDNHDSYTYNLFHLMAQVYGTPPKVVTNDDARWSTLVVEDFDALVVSPGPGHPGRERDLGMVREVVRHTSVPLLGVCLGHQAIALLAGADVVGAPRPRHGHLSRIRHRGDELFAGIPQEFVAVRYHSLCVSTHLLPGSLEPTAWSEDGVLMGLRHRERPRWGVQFHPESVASEHGARLIENFGRLAAKARAKQGNARRMLTAAPAAPATTPRPAPTRPAWRLLHREIDREVDTVAAFTELFGHLDHAFWLDSSRVEPGLSRFSFLGAPTGADGEILTYVLGEGVTVHTMPEPTGRDGPATWKESVFDALRARLAEPVEDAPELPFDLVGGYVGYFGYELKEELGAPNRHRAATPDAVWMAATRIVAVDHEQQVTHLLALTRSPDDTEASTWLDAAARRLADLRPRQESTEAADVGYDPVPNLLRGRRDYLDDVKACRRLLHAGESYEMCLTTRTRLPLRTDPLTLYLAQRRSNPAPYAAYLRLGDVAVLCSSPERFLRIRRDRTVDTKPIKGTAPRGRDPVGDASLRARLATDPKVRAENLMIVDLMRNDLGRVCEIGSVHVPAFMAVESYATVHQLVSTVRGTLRPGVDAIDCVRACFPAGSMTGAPKLRTMELLDRLEDTARGVYAGSLGFLSRNGTADLNVVIRTAVADGNGLSVGAGGAIVLDSDPAEEFEEMLLKARAAVRVRSDHVTTPPHPPLTVDAVLFDLDGTLVDSRAVIERCWSQWAAEYDISLADFTRHPLHGRTSAAIVADLLPADLVEQGHRRIVQLEAGEVQGVHALPGALDLLRTLPAGRTAIVTSGERVVASARIRAAGIEMPVLVTADDVTRGKPDPEPFLLAADRLGVDPTRCLAVEDSPTGLAAARAAGMVTVAVTTTHPAAALDGGVADLVVDSLSELVVRTRPDGAVELHAQTS